MIPMKHEVQCCQNNSKYGTKWNKFIQKCTCDKNFSKKDIVNAYLARDPISKYICHYDSINKEK